MVNKNSDTASDRWASVETHPSIDRYTQAAGYQLILTHRARLASPIKYDLQVVELRGSALINWCLGDQLRGAT